MKRVNVLLTASAVLAPFWGYLYVGKILRGIGITFGSYALWIAANMGMGLVIAAVDPNTPLINRILGVLGAVAIWILNIIVWSKIAKDLIRLNEIEARKEQMEKEAESQGPEES